MMEGFVTLPPALDYVTLCTSLVAFSAFMGIGFLLADWREKYTTRFYLFIAVNATFIELLLWFYPKLVGATEANVGATHSRMWVDHTHFQLELTAWAVTLVMMTSLCIVDSLFYMPMDMYRMPKEASRSYIHQVYVHHAMGLAGMLPMLLAIRDVGGFPLTDKEKFDTWNVGAIHGNSQNTQIVLNMIRFSNRFVFMAEMSTIFLHIRNMVRIRSTETGVPTSPLVRTLSGLAFAISFYACRILPILPGLVCCANCGIPQLLSSLVAFKERVADPLGVTSLLFHADFIAISERAYSADATIQKQAALRTLGRLQIPPLEIALPFVGFALLNLYWGSEVAKGVAKACGRGRKIPGAPRPAKGGRSVDSHTKKE